MCFYLPGHFPHNELASSPEHLREPQPHDAAVAERGEWPRCGLVRASATDPSAGLGASRAGRGLRTAPAFDRPLVGFIFFLPYLMKCKLSISGKSLFFTFVISQLSNEVKNRAATLPSRCISFKGEQAYLELLRP